MSNPRSVRTTFRFLNPLGHVSPTIFATFISPRWGEKDLRGTVIQGGRATRKRQSAVWTKYNEPQSGSKNSEPGAVATGSSAAQGRVGESLTRSLLLPVLTSCCPASRYGLTNMN